MRKRSSNSLKRRQKIKFGIRKNIFGTPEIPRLSVFKSNKGITAQLIDDVTATTLASASYRDSGISKGTKTEVAKQVGQNLAKNAASANISTVVFDRSGYLFHGIVKSLADGAKEGGLKF